MSLEILHHLKLEKCCFDAIRSRGRIFNTFLLPPQIPFEGANLQYFSTPTSGSQVHQMLNEFKGKSTLHQERQDLSEARARVRALG